MVLHAILKVLHLPSFNGFAVSDKLSSGITLTSSGQKYAKIIAFACMPSHHTDDLDYEQ